MKRKNKGDFYEKVALDFLIHKNLSLISSNWFCRFGEIDLIMEYNSQLLIFIEVRSKDNLSCVRALESVDFIKQKKIIKSAKMFLSCNNKYVDYFCRFDVVSIEKGQIKWIKNAFEVE